jgi:hypothetical protein
MTPLAGSGKLKNHKLAHIPPRKMIKRQHENVECLDEKISRKKLDFCVHCGVPLHLEGAYTRFNTLKHY